MSARNVALFHMVANQIEREPSRYDQEIWGGLIEKDPSCRTAHCVAGWAAKLHGAAPQGFRKRADNKIAEPDWEFCIPKGPYDGICYVDGNGAVYTATYAQELLGLTTAEADELFDSDWRPRDGMTVPEALRDIAAGGDI